MTDYHLGLAETGIHQNHPLCTRTSYKFLHPNTPSPVSFFSRGIESHLPPPRTHTHRLQLQRVAAIIKFPSSFGSFPIPPVNVIIRAPHRPNRKLFRVKARRPITCVPCEGVATVCTAIRRLWGRSGLISATANGRSWGWKGRELVWVVPVAGGYFLLSILQGVDGYVETSRWIWQILSKVDVNALLRRIGLSSINKYKIGTPKRNGDGNYWPRLLQFRTPNYEIDLLLLTC